MKSILFAYTSSKNLYVQKSKDASILIMCTFIINWQPGEKWPLLLAANRDELISRAWKKPDRHWPDRPEVIAGHDDEAGGSWLGVNDHGVIAGILNRKNSLGPMPGKRSRGELVLEALDHADAVEAAKAAGADAFVTADLKYHDFFSAENKIVLADVGHYESEQHIKNILVAHLKKKITNFAVLLSKTNTNPVKYN